MLQKVSPVPDLIARVHQALLDAICTGQLAPGERFTQEAIAQRLGVSRQPVLQALLLLREQGLIVDTENRRGVTVAPLDAVFITGLYEVRAVLDALAVRTAAHEPRPELAEPGRAIIQAGRRAAARGEYTELVELDLAFHQLLYEASGNPVLIENARAQRHHTRRVMATYLQQSASLRTVWNEHQAILAAVVKGDARLAEKLSRQHAEQSGRQLVTSLFAQAAQNRGPASREPSPRVPRLPARSTATRRPRQ